MPALFDNMNMNGPPPASAMLFPFILILSILSVAIGTIVITMTVLYNKAKDLDRQDKLSYISQIWIGSRSGFLNTMAWLWCPVMLALAFYGPIRNLMPYAQSIGRAVGYLAAQGQSRAGQVAAQAHARMR